jgi:formylglycine-generating enzyme required for sulfatase activity
MLRVGCWLNARVAAVLAAGLGAPVLGQIDPNSGIDFVRIGAVGNAPWAGDGTAGDRAVGRGGVNYEYNIGKFEVTTAQWTEFFNAAFDRPANDRLPNLIPPNAWGAVPTTPTVAGGQRWSVPAGHEMYPVGDISWRMAAMYCNWLCNGKSTDRAAFMNGAYDASTFGYFGNIFTDQVAHNPGAQYWIPTWDEWLKAAHYDPNKNGAGQDGWWKYSITRDTAPISDPPGSLAPGSAGECNAGGWHTIYNGVVSPFAVPLGAYSNITSPWGLFDTAGGTAEWTESVLLVAGTKNRYYDGSWWSDGPTEVDQIQTVDAQFPNYSTFDLGFRIASSVPAPAPAALLLCGLFSLFSARPSRIR